MLKITYILVPIVEVNKMRSLTTTENSLTLLATLQIDVNQLTRHNIEALTDSIIEFLISNELVGLNIVILDRNIDYEKVMIFGT